MPGRNRIAIRRNSASSIDPGAFRAPGPASAACGQVRPANRSDIGVIGREDRGAGIPRAAVTGGLKQILSLRRERLEVGVVGAGVRRAPRPRRAQLRVQRASCSHGVKDGGITRPYIHHQVRQTWGHAERLRHVQSLLRIVAEGIEAARARSVGGHQRNGNVFRLSGVAEVYVQVVQIGSVIFHQPERLAGTCERGSAVVCRAHVTAQKRV